VRWPGTVAPGSLCDQLVQQADLLATIADVLGVSLPENAGEDSFSFLPLLKGSAKATRRHAVNQSTRGLLALRDGPWKLIFGAGSGSPSPGGDNYPGQLYNLADDIGETNNLFPAKPEVVARLSRLMKKVVEDGRSTPGAAQANDKPLKWKISFEAARKNTPRRAAQKQAAGK
jgi:arylsulfatase A